MKHGQSSREVKPPVRCRWCKNALHLHGQFFVCLKKKSSVTNKDGKKSTARAKVLGDDRCSKFRFDIKKYNMTMRHMEGVKL
jgi:hypothetical protein